MPTFRVPILLVVSALTLSPFAAQAKKPAGLAPYAGSYTGRAVSNAGASSLSKGATLTFTGKKSGLRGTFLYTGILNQGGVAKTLVQTFNLTRTGLISGQVSIGEGELQGTGSGKVTLSKGRLNFKMTYKLSGTMSTTVSLTGKVLFQKRWATLTATVVSSDPGFNGTLTVKGRR